MAPVRIGIVGYKAGRSWAAVSHLPALRQLTDEFEVVAVANTNQASSDEAAAEGKIRLAFPNAAALVVSSEVDLVVVNVKVPFHGEVVRAALEAGKHVFCEWPLGNGLKEAEELLQLANAKGVRVFVGTQVLFAPEVLHAKKLIDEGYLGELLSTTLVGTGMAWGEITNQNSTYLYDVNNGATLLSIPLGHTLAAVTSVLGPVASVNARLTTRVRNAIVADKDSQVIPVTSPDQVLLHGELKQANAPISIHYRGGMAHGAGLIWELTGTKGDLRITGTSGHAQLSTLSLLGGQGSDTELKPIAVPSEGSAVVVNVKRLYQAIAADLKSGSTTAPSFSDAVKLHKLLDAIEQSAKSGQTVNVVVE